MQKNSSTGGKIFVTYQPQIEFVGAFCNPDHTCHFYPFRCNKKSYNNLIFQMQNTIIANCDFHECETFCLFGKKIGIVKNDIEFISIQKKTLLILKWAMPKKGCCSSINYIFKKNI